MDDRNSNTSRAPKSSGVEPQAQYQAFSWLTPDAESDDARFAALTHDIARGISLVVDLVHSSALIESNGEAPLFAITERERLLRLAVASAELLEQEAFDRIEIATKEAFRMARAKKGGA